MIEEITSDGSVSAGPSFFGFQPRAFGGQKRDFTQHEESVQDNKDYYYGNFHEKNAAAPL